jgi:DNA-binding NarL/FixJ family response regulator
VVVISQSDTTQSTAGCVLAVDDHAEFRGAVHRLIAAAPNLVLVGEADSGERAVTLVHELEPDVVLIDVRMPGMGGIAAARAIKAFDDSIVVVVISTTHPDELPDEAHDAGDEVVWKGDLRPRLLEEIWQRHASGRREAERRLS